MVPAGANHDMLYSMVVPGDAAPQRAPGGRGEGVVMKRARPEGAGALMERAPAREGEG